MCFIPETEMIKLQVNNAPSLLFTARHLFTLALLFAVLIVRKQASMGLENWKKAIMPIKSEEDCLPSPIITVKIGCIGLIVWLVGCLLCFALVFFAIDLVLLEGRVVCNNIDSILIDLTIVFRYGFQLVKKLITAIAS